MIILFEIIVWVSPSTKSVVSLSENKKLSKILNKIIFKNGLDNFSDERVHYHVPISRALV